MKKTVFFAICILLVLTLTGCDSMIWVPVKTETQLLKLMAVLEPAGDYALMDLLTPDEERSFLEKRALDNAKAFDVWGRKIRFAYTRDMSKYAMRMDGGVNF